MRISINGKELPAGQGIVQQIRLRAQPKAPVEAHSLDEAGMTRSYKRSLLGSYGVGYAAIALGSLLSLPKADDGATAATFFLVVAMFVAIIAYFHRKDIRQWRTRSGPRADELPPAGTRALAGTESLTIFGTAYPWEALTVEAVDFAMKQSRRRSWLEVDRLRLADADGRTFVLDVFGYRGGGKLVAMAAQRLWPQVRRLMAGS